MLRRMISPWALVASALCLGATALAVPAAHAASPSYVALGDSYSQRCRDAQSHNDHGSTCEVLWVQGSTPA